MSSGGFLTELGCSSEASRLEYALAATIQHEEAGGPARYLVGDAALVRYNERWVLAYPLGYSTIVRVVALQSENPLEEAPVCVITPSLGSAFPTCQEFNPSTPLGRLELAIGYIDGFVLLTHPFSIAAKKGVSGRRFRADFEAPSAVKVLRWLPSSKHIFITGHSNGYVCVYDSSSSHRKGSLGGDSSLLPPTGPILKWRVGLSEINDLAFTSDGACVAVASRDGHLTVFEFDSGKLVARMRSQFGGVLCCCFSPDDRMLAAGGEDDYLTLWDAFEGKLLGIGIAHHSWVSRIAFFPLVRNQSVYWVVSAAQDGCIGVWKFEDGLMQLDTLVRVHEEPVRGLSVAFGFIITICAMDRVKLWTAKALESV